MVAVTAEKITDRKRVLIVEDDIDMNDLLCGLMSGAGYDTYSAVDGTSAADMAKEFKPDVILLDIMLPGKNGIDLCKELSREASTAAIPVIIVSVKNDVHTKLSAFIAGAKRYITKPFGVEDLVNEVRKTLRQKELTSGVDHYRDKCSGTGDYGVFPTNFERMTEVCDKEI